MSNNSRRRFLKQSTMAGLGITMGSGIAKPLLADSPVEDSQRPVGPGDPIIDIHQHIFYDDRTDGQLINHQRTMGVSHTIMLPAGSPVFTQSTHYGRFNGLGGGMGANKACYDFAQAHADSFSFAANEVPDLPDAVKDVEKYLKLGAKMIAEVKFGVACDSQGMQKFYELAAEYNVPILMHWQYETINFGFPRFYKMLEKYPKTKFIGHAQTFWANIDKNQEDHPWELYPKGSVTKGGITDRYLSDYENMYGDMSAGSARNAFTRDEEFTKDFYKRHQDKLLFGSDCNDSVGTGKDCIGAQTIAVIRKLAPKTIERKLLYENAKKLFKL